MMLFIVMEEFYTKGGDLIVNIYVFTCKSYFFNKSQSNSVLVVNIHTV